jgi:hypothetical protein
VSLRRIADDLNAARIPTALRGARSGLCGYRPAIVLSVVFDVVTTVLLVIVARGKPRRTAGPAGREQEPIAARRCCGRG